MRTFLPRRRFSGGAAGWCLWLAAGLLQAALPDPKPLGFIRSNTPAATPYFLQDSGKPGPLVFISGGVHGDEPAGAGAADQIRHWPIVRGKIVVLPRANAEALPARKRLTPGADTNQNNLNRNFPRAQQNEPPRGELAAEIWALLKQFKPDWVIDLHEGSDFRIQTTNSVGSSLIVVQKEAGKQAAALMHEAVNATITNAARQFMLLRSPVDGSLARAAGEHLNAQAMILETTIKAQPLSQRIRQHRVMVHTLLRHLGMIDESVTTEWMTDQRPDRARRQIAVYDAAGTSGPGVSRLHEIAGASARLQAVPIGPEDIVRGALSQFDALICPGGTGSGQAAALGETGRRQVKQFVEAGGGYVGICAGAFLACDGFSWGLKILNARTVSPQWRRGTGTVRVELTEAGKKILGEANGLLEIRYANGPILTNATSTELPAYETLAWFRSELAENNSPKGIMINSPAMVAAPCGQGRVLCLSPHPEQAKGLEKMVERGIEWAAGNRRPPSP